jgi:Uma2 family endonuclease
MQPGAIQVSASQSRCARRASPPEIGVERVYDNWINPEDPLMKAEAFETHYFKPVHLHMPTRLDDDLFFAICQANREYRIERTANGDIDIMPPTGGETGSRNARLNRLLGNWADRDGRGEVFGSSTGFALPNGATRSPDASWVKHERLTRLTPEQKRTFLPLAPDFVLELASPSDSVESLREKMDEYLANGTSMGWLLVPEERKVYVYARGEDVQCLENPTELSGDPLMPGFKLGLSKSWEPGF